MVFHNFDELIAHVKGQPSRARMAVAAAGDAHTIEAVLRARAEGIVTPILVGDKAVIDQVLAELGEHIPAEDIHDEPDLAEAARKAVALVRAGEADFLMKGKLDTSVLLKAVVNKETGLGKGGVMSHFTAFEIPTYHKLLMPVDGGMVTYPTLEQKKAIIENTVGALRAMGYDCPKVGVLACVESRARMAVAAAGDAHTIEAVLRARAEGIVTPILVGDKAVIDQVLAELGEHIPAEDIHDEPDLAEAARKAVALVRAGEADFLMKGKLDTSVLLKAVVNKETGLGKGGVMSHFTAFEIPTYHKLLMPVDGGMVTYPTLEQKKAIIENTVGALRAMGYDCPKVGVLACVEKLNPKMPETVEGDALKQMNQRGELTGCVVEGPISYDCAVSREIAAFKGFESPCAGDCDVLVAPNIHAGNIMGKMLTVTCKAKMAGFIVGARCPIVMTSRGSSAEEKYLSIVISAAAARNQ